MGASEKLALFDGPKAVQDVPEDIFEWPIITEEDEAAVLEVLRRRAMSGIDVTRQFEGEFAAWMGVAHALGFSSGTAALHGAMYGCGIGVGDEMICPSNTFWASALPVFSLGGTVVFADIDPHTLCLDPGDIERHITERTKAVMVVHCASYPAEMDPIMEIARQHKLKVIEDVSHAQGGMHRGRLLGTIGDVGAMSLMSGKSFAVGEAGILVTDDREIYVRAIAFGHRERFSWEGVEAPEEYARFSGAPLGGHKYRMHQLSSAVGRVQLKYYEERIGEIDRAMNYFWDRLEGIPGVRSHRPEAGQGHRKGGWYWPKGLYVPEELDGLSVSRFCEALRAEGVRTSPGYYRPLHLHPIFNEADVYGHGKPTRIANANRDLRQPAGSLPVAENIGSRVYSIPWFRRDRREAIDQYVVAFRKVLAQYRELIPGDQGNPERLGDWSAFTSEA